MRDEIVFIDLWPAVRPPLSFFFGLQEVLGKYWEHEGGRQHEHIGHSFILSV